MIVDSYIQSYRNQRSQWPITQCAVDVARADDLAGTLDQLAKTLRPKLPSLWPNLFKAQVRASGFEFEMVDLRSLCVALIANTADAQVKIAATAVLTALEPGGYVLAEGHLGARVEGCGGVSVYLSQPDKFGDLAVLQRSRLLQKASVGRTTERLLRRRAPVTSKHEGSYPAEGSRFPTFPYSQGL